MIIKKILHKILEVPFIFQLQQKVCNNYDAVFIEFSEYLNVSNKSIIEIGCSTANCASEIVDMKKNYFVGVDLDKNYINRAKKIAPLGNFFEMDARKLVFDNNKFDLAVFNGVIHHMDDELILSCLSEVKRVIKDNGKVIISEPVFSKGIISTILLKLDRGNYIRKQEEYKNLFKDFSIERERYFRFSAHKFCSFVLSKKS
tara:strand:+ start:19 stop:621 length:603 start_codon:yes stop_codon:yes gene_type:complete